MPIENFLAMIMCSIGLIALFVVVILIMMTFGPLAELRIRQPPAPATDVPGGLAVSTGTTAGSATVQLAAPLRPGVYATPGAPASTGTPAPLPPGVYAAPTVPPATSASPAATPGIYSAPSTP